METCFGVTQTGVSTYNTFMTGHHSLNPPISSKLDVISYWDKRSHVAEGLQFFLVYMYIEYAVGSHHEIQI